MTIEPHTNRHRILLGIMSLGTVLRLYVVWSGGQFYSPDEIRYLRALKFAWYLCHGHLLEACDLICQFPDHGGYTVTCLPAALVQSLLKVAVSIPFSSTYWAPALLNVVCYVFTCLLLVAISRRIGLSRMATHSVVLFYSLSASCLYYVRFALPYHQSLCFQLAALALVLTERARFTHYLLAGILSAGATWVYNGYWYWTAILAATLIGRAFVPGAWRSAAGFCLGVLLPVLGLGLYAGGRHIDVVSNYTRFAATITHGDFGEGWFIPFAFLWHTEHGLGALWLVLAVVALIELCRRRLAPRPGLIAIWWLLVYALMVVCSNLLLKFVIYGRTSQLIILALILAAGIGIDRVRQRIRATLHRRLVFCAFGVVVVQAVVNLTPILKQKYPSQVLRQAMAEYADLGVIYSVQGPPHHIDPQFLRPHRYVVTNYRYLFPINGLSTVPSGLILREEPHPLQYLPHRYDGYTKVQRSLLKNADLTMKIIDTFGNTGNR